MLKQLIGLLLSLFGFFILSIAVTTSNKSVFMTTAAFSFPSIIVGMGFLIG